ncbi:MAG TPA: peptidylprolyl isomerase, partial [Candidatus Wallbacteria bacterium]|nr:peptidylprolyl isomerase [Candidatus Wallbacteria bacterium]
MHKGSIFFSKSNIIVKVVIWAVVAAFVLSVFIFAGTFNLNQKQAADIKEKELAEMNKRQVNAEDRNKVLASIAGTTTSENVNVTVGDFFQILHNQDEQYQKFYSTKTQRENLLEKIIEAKIVEQKTKSIVILPADYEEEINKIAATFPSRQVFDEQMKQRGMTRERLEEYFRSKIQEKKLKEQLSKPRDVAETLLKEYYEKNKAEFTEMKKLPGGTTETAMVKEFNEVKDAIRDKLLKEVSDAEIQKYYNEHLGQFKNPVSVKLAHIFIKSDSAAIKESIKPTEEELKKFYDFNKTKYKTTRSFEVKTILKRFDNKEMRDMITVSDSEAVEFHAKNPVKFQKRAHADIKNILIDPKAQHRVDALKPSEHELRAFYDETAEVKASHILVDSETLAIELKKKIDSGAKLEELAAANSKCPSKDKGGDLGYFKHNGSMVKEFEDVAFKLKLNEVSAPVKTQFGWHIIKVTDQKKAYEKAFEEVTAEVKTAYTTKKLEDNAKKLAEEISERIKKGENFADVAKKESDAASKNNGGVL